MRPVLRDAVTGVFSGLPERQSFSKIFVLADDSAQSDAGIARWCNGNTLGFGPSILGSSPSRAISETVDPNRIRRFFICAKPFSKNHLEPIGDYSGWYYSRGVESP